MLKRAVIKNFLTPQSRINASRLVRYSSNQVSQNTIFDYSKYRIRSINKCFGLNLVVKSQAAFIERFGKLNRPANDGLNFTIPFIENIRRVSMREFSISIEPQSLITKDNVQVTIAGSLHFKVIDPEKACYETHDLLVSIVSLAQSSMRTAAGFRELDTLNHDRANLNVDILLSIHKEALKWGIEILRYEITEVKPDPRVAEAMDSQSIAERKRRETILNAEAQREHDITISEGKRQSVINEAEAHKIKVILEAEADKEKVILKAQAQATSINMIGEALRANTEASKYLLAEKYMKNVSSMLPKSTVFIPDNINDISKMVATATSINGTLNETK